MQALSDRELLRTRLLQRGMKYVETVGLSLGLTDDFAQQICADEGVTPRQFAHLWSSTEGFLADMFCELADQARIDRADSQTLITTWQYLSMRTEDLHSVRGRRRVLIDVIRTAAQYNFDVVTASNKWRTYAAISTTVMSWPNAASRARIAESLRASEVAFIETMESFYRNVLPTIGYRLKPLLGNDYQPFVIAAASVIEGLGIVRSTVPALAESHFTMAGHDGEEVWSVAALSFMGVVDAFIEPDPAFTPQTAIARLNGGIDVTPSETSRDVAGF